jgi:hypothetical protein
MQKGLKYKHDQDHNNQDNYCFEAHDISSFKKTSELCGLFICSFKPLFPSLFGAL